MTHNEISLQTKKKLAASLKKFMMSKSLNKITVTDIIKDCGVNRKTFYYHFAPPEASHRNRRNFLQE